MRSLDVDVATPTYWPAGVPGVHVTRVERQPRAWTTVSDQYAIAVVLEGAFDGWYRGAIRTGEAGRIKIENPVTCTARAACMRRTRSRWRSSRASSSPTRRPRSATEARFSSACRPSTRTSTAARARAVHAALARRDATPLEIATLVSETLAEVVRACAEQPTGAGEPRVPRAVRRARELLEDALDEKITLDALAAHAGLDKFHLVRAFRAEVGLPPHAYVTHLRVARAATLLEHGASVAEAAQAVGLYDESQLHRHFRRILRITPGRFARALGVRSSQLHPIRGRAAVAGSAP